ncbi:MAG: recombinase family protein [Acutalibacter muris]|nr:recombinase family protein [Acutalibacter muris]
MTAVFRKASRTGGFPCFSRRFPLRLFVWSSDDERAGESVSIENQKRILEDYARKNGFSNIRHFTDDGIRGTTFKRPGLDAMLDEIRAGNVATVIIKDDCVILELNTESP